MVFSGSRRMGVVVCKKLRPVREISHPKSRTGFLPNPDGRARSLNKLFPGKALDEPLSLLRLEAGDPFPSSTALAIAASL